MNKMHGWLPKLEADRNVKSRRMSEFKKLHEVITFLMILLIDTGCFNEELMLDNTDCVT